VTQEAHLIWSLPLSITLVTICLCLIMGPVTLVGIGVLVAFVPVVERITSTMLKIRHQRVSWTDKRIGIINAMLQGVRLCLLNSAFDRMTVYSPRRIFLSLASLEDQGNETQQLRSEL
jgi:hypothetical protein